jgi:hypothetical protein
MCCREITVPMKWTSTVSLSLTRNILLLSSCCSESPGPNRTKQVSLAVPWPWHWVRTTWETLELESLNPRFSAGFLVRNGRRETRQTVGRPWFCHHARSVEWLREGTTLYQGGTEEGQGQKCEFDALTKTNVHRVFPSGHFLFQTDLKRAEVYSRHISSNGDPSLPLEDSCSLWVYVVRIMQ